MAGTEPGAHQTQTNAQGRGQAESQEQAPGQTGAKRRPRLDEEHGEDGQGQQESPGAKQTHRLDPGATGHVGLVETAQAKNGQGNRGHQPRAHEDARPGLGHRGGIPQPMGQHKDRNHYQGVAHGQHPGHGSTGGLWENVRSRGSMRPRQRGGHRVLSGGPAHTLSAFPSCSGQKIRGSAAKSRRARNWNSPHGLQLRLGREA